ncbi:MAG TPA: shikimate kinase [Pyrinomonadaceae bacterium]|jgi:Shikimate kinase|nr:shikimate kinase [Pyrinomonadaceae bacterium]
MTFTRPIVITGFMGCGKTEVARSLAKRLNLQMTDLDELIAQIEGRTAAQLIREEGEHSFRAIETKTLRSLLDGKTAGVIALGGGAWIEAANRALLERADGLSVWLDTPFEVCWNRIAASKEDRPLGRTEEQTRELYLKRLPVYELARIRVQTSGSDDPDKLASLITSDLNRLNFW